MTVLVIGNHYWGHGVDVDDAKRQFRAAGGTLALGYTIYEFSGGLKFNGVDQMGYVHWTDEQYVNETTRHEPKITEVQPRKVKK